MTKADKLDYENFKKTIFYDIENKNITNETFNTLKIMKDLINKEKDKE